MNSDLQSAVASALLKIGAVRFVPKAPITFKSGLKSPVYVDNRTLPYHPAEWQIVIDGFLQISKDLPCDIVAGVETAGIPHSAAVGFAGKIPSIYVRKQPKEHGTRSRVEGGDVQGKHVLLIEDLVTTGGSSLAGIDALRQEGANVDHCMAIVSYGFKEAQDSFAAAAITLHTLTTFQTIIEQAKSMYSPKELEIVSEWFSSPYTWAKRHGFE